MSANPKDFLQPTSTLSAEAIRPFPASRKIFVPGSRPDLKIGMREVTLTPTPSSHGAEENPPITIYDTSGPYTDPTAHIDLRAGLAPLREKWILERNDTVLLDGPSSEYGRGRAHDPKLASRRFGDIRKPRRARRGARARHHPEQHQPPGIRADDHRPQLPGEDQHQYRQLGRVLEHRGGSRENGVVGALGRRHAHGPVHRQAHPRDARVDNPQFPGAGRHGADLPGAGKGRRQG